MADKAIETKVKETKDENGNVVERVTETWVEKLPMELKTRKIEKISHAPVVTEFVENYEDGMPVDTLAEMATNTSTQPKGLSAMKTRITVGTDVFVSYGSYIVIAILLATIAIKMWF